MPTEPPWLADAAESAEQPCLRLDGETCPGEPPHWAAGAPADSCPECRKQERCRAAE